MPIYHLVSVQISVARIEENMLHFGLFDSPPQEQISPAQINLLAAVFVLAIGGPVKPVSA